MDVCSVWLEKKQARLDLEKKQERKRAKAMEEELEWIRKGPSVRAAGNDGSSASDSGGAAGAGLAPTATRL